MIRASDFPAVMERSEQLLDDDTALLTGQERRELEAAVKRAWQVFYEVVLDESADWDEWEEQF